MSKVSNAVVETPPTLYSLAETYDATISATAEITLQTGTTFIEVAAIDKPIMLKWGTSAATTADFDHVIPTNTVRGFYVPNDSNGVKYTAVNFIEQAATAILAVSEFGA